MPNGRVPVRQGGFTYLGLLLLIAIGGIGLAAVGQVWHTEAQREREKELLFVGEQYARAIGSYYESTPGAVKQYPASLEELLEDRRFPVMRRHLRKLYRDPVTGEADWALILQQGKIVGVHSQSERKPVKQDGFAEAYAGFTGAAQYRDWRFVHGAGSGSVAMASEAQPSAGPVDAVAVEGRAPATSSAPAPETPSSGDDRSSTSVACQAAWAAENLQCRSGCGNPAGEACRSCVTASFQHYRACLKGGG